MDAGSRYCWATFALIGAVTLARLGYLAFGCPFDLAPDEAHYWDWSRQLDWCYYSKGPLVAWLIRASCAILGETMFAVRLPAVLCGGLLLLGLRALILQVYHDERLGLMVVGVALTLPLVAAGALLMTIDAPFVAAWMWAIVFTHRAAVLGSSWAWPCAGGCVLLGVLAKHTMILFIPSLALFLLTTPPLRSRIAQPGFWIMASIGALGGLPVLLWNATHDWVTLLHTRGHAGFDALAFHPLGPLRFLGGQAVVFLGFWLVLWLVAMWKHRPTCEGCPHRRFLWWMSLPTFAFFALFALKNGGGEPNWPVVAYLAGMVLAAGGRDLESGVRSQGSGVIIFAGIGLVVTLSLHQSMWVQPALAWLAGPASEERPMPMRRLDPTVRLRGWRHLAYEVDRLRAELRERGVEPVLAAARWTQAGELAFYCEGQPRVACIGSALGDRHSQYDLWRPSPLADADLYAGRTFILIGVHADQVRDAFADVEPTCRIEYRENGHLIATHTLVIAHGFLGFRTTSAGGRRY